jgi:hypothetical protein
MVFPSKAKWISLIAADLQRIGCFNIGATGMDSRIGRELKRDRACLAARSVTDRHAIAAMLS